MNIWGLVGAAVLGGVVVASAAVVTGVVEIPYSIELKSKAAPAEVTPVADGDAAPQPYEAPAQAADAAVVADVVAAPPPKPRAKPAAPRPQPVSTRPASQPQDNVGYFFDELAPYGNWVANDDYGYVFVPARRGAGWRPYQEGQWVWTDDYGWYWESAEPFGWATYHYGRWDYDPDFGWYWVPGDTWAPAWVTFRVGGGSIGWAPIAPDRQGYAYGKPRRYDAPVAESWIFVDDQDFGDADIGRRAAPVRDIPDYFGRAQDVRRPDYRDGRYYNDPIGRPNQPGRAIVDVDNQGDIFRDERGGRIGVFRPRIDADQFDDRPQRFEREVPPSDRTVIHEYVPQQPDVAGLLSAALLSVLDPTERRDIRRNRDEGQPDRMQSEIKRLNAENATSVDEERRSAQSRQGETDAAIRKASAARQAEQDRVNQERADRAGDVLKKMDNVPPPVQADNPPDARQPDQQPSAEPPRPAPDQAKPDANGNDRPGKRGKPPAETAPSEQAAPEPAPAEPQQPRPSRKRPPVDEQPAAPAQEQAPAVEQPAPQAEPAPPAEAQPAQPQERKRKQRPQVQDPAPAPDQAPPIEQAQPPVAEPQAEQPPQQERRRRQQQDQQPAQQPQQQEPQQQQEQQQQEQQQREPQRRQEQQSPQQGQPAPPEAPQPEAAPRQQNDQQQGEPRRGRDKSRQQGCPDGSRPQQDGQCAPQ